SQSHEDFYFNFLANAARRFLGRSLVFLGRRSRTGVKLTRVWGVGDLTHASRPSRAGKRIGPFRVAAVTLVLCFSCLRSLAHAQTPPSSDPLLLARQLYNAEKYD